MAKQQITKTSLMEALNIIAQAGSLTFEEFKPKGLAELYVAVLNAVEATEAIKKTVGPKLLEENDEDLKSWGLKAATTYQFDDSKCDVIIKDRKALDKAVKALDKVMRLPEIEELQKAVIDAQHAIDDNPKVIKAKANLAAAQTVLDSHLKASEKEVKKAIEGKDYDHAYDGMTWSVKTKVLKRAK